MENESILMNKLEMMARERKNNENDTEGWIVEGAAARDTKDVTRGGLKKEEEVLRQKYANYNFLEDTER